MKKLYVLLLLLCIGTAAGYAKKPRKARTVSDSRETQQAADLQRSDAAPLRLQPGLSQEVLFEMQEHESLSPGEYQSTLALSGYHFVCMLWNEDTERETLVWNGSRIRTAQRIRYHHMDASNLSQSIYEWEDNNQHWLQLEEKTFGPYASVSYHDGVYPDREFIYSKTTFRYPAAKYRFGFTQMDEQYVHDHDGTIYKYLVGRDVYHSPDHKHQATIDAADKLKITIDRKPYTFPLSDKWILINKYFPHLYLFDDGSCFYEFYAYRKDDVNKHIQAFAYYITSTVSELQDDEIFDLERQQITTQPLWDYADDQDLDIALQDKTKEHFFTAKADYDYVLIDGQPYGKGCPIEAFYDEAAHAYVWVAVEQNRIVRYIYAL